MNGASLMRRPAFCTTAGLIALNVNTMTASVVPHCWRTVSNTRISASTDAAMPVTSIAVTLSPATNEITAMSAGYPGGYFAPTSSAAS